MCGICGFTGFQDDTLIRTMMDALGHRGPDARGFVSEEQVTLGHTRLSIIDLSPRGRQPLQNEDGDIRISYNGEIYNFQSLRADLSRHTFSSDSDTEVIVHAYEEYGLDFLQKLRGMFAFAIHDGKKKQVLLARDPIGKKPLYYSWDGRRLIFASEIKAILAAYRALKLPCTISRAALCSFLKNQYVSGPQTLVSGISRLPPGSYLRLSLDTGTCEIASFWTIRETLTDYSEEYCAQRLQDLLKESVRLRMLAADVPIGSFLSGGIDSTGITALAKQEVSYDFHTFTAGFGDDNADFPLARDVAADLGTIHHEVPIDMAAVIHDFDKVTWHFDEPLGDAAIIANYYLAKEARKFVKVVLAGEGSDELFGGYSSYKAGLQWHRWFSLPNASRRILNSLISLVPFSGNPAMDRTFVYAHYLGQDSPEMAQQYSWQITGINDDEQRWLGISLCRDQKETFTLPAGVHDPLNRLLAFDCLNHLPDLYLMKADKAIMAHGVEERTPILDREIISFAFSIPPQYKIFNGVEKYIWRKALQGVVPKEILNRPKKGFGVPYTAWIAGEMREVATQNLQEGILCRNILHADRLQKLVGNLAGTPSNRSALITWNLFALERWATVFAIQEIR